MYFRFGLFLDGSFQHAKSKAMVYDMAHFNDRFLPVIMKFSTDLSNTVVVCDGITNDTGLYKLHESFMDRYSIRHQFQIPSMQIIPADTDTGGIHKNFYTEPWAFVEYCIAAPHSPTIADETKDVPLEYFLREKFYYAGSCAMDAFRRTGSTSWTD
jgi:hypothetical protein